MSVHRTLGCRFTEKVYQEALEVELNRENIPYVRETPIHVQYKGIELSTEFIPDFICYDKIIVELKAVKELDASIEPKPLITGKWLKQQLRS